MEAKINGTGKTGVMLNEIVLNVFDAFAIKELVTKALEKDKNEKWHHYDIMKWEKFLETFESTFTEPSKLEDKIL